MVRSTVASLLRSTQAFCSQVCEKMTLEYGIAYYSKAFAELPQTNQFREVFIEDPARMLTAFEEAEAWFGQQGLTCHRWAPAVGQDANTLAGFLADRGFVRRESTALALVNWPNLSIPADVRVLHARAVRAALRKTFVNAQRPATSARRERLASLCEERLNDPQYDMFVALIGGEPAGRCALYQVGDIARLMDLAVLPAFEENSIRTALVAHVVTLAKRLAMQNICLQIDRDETERRAWLEACGFVRDGIVVEFERSESGGH